MYTQCSDEFKSKIMSFSRQFRAKLVFDSFEVTDDVFSVKVKSGLNLGDELTLGTTTSATCTVETYANGYNYKNKKFQLFFGLKLDSGEFEYIPYGVYVVMQATRKEQKITLECADLMSKTDKIMGTGLNFPTTADLVLDDICNKLNLNYEIEGLKDIIIPFRPSAKTTARELIGKIASLAGKNAIFDREGVLRFVWYADKGAETNADYIDNPVISENNFTVEYLLYTISNKRADVYGDSESLTGITVTNEFVLAGKQKGVWESIKGFAYRPVELKQRLGNILIDVWDIITVTSNDIEVKTIPMSLNTTYDGGITVNISAKAPDTEKGYKSPSQIQAEKQAEKDENNSLVLTTSNEISATVGSTEKKLLGLQFNTQSESLPFINATIQLENTKSGVITVLLKINGIIYSNYKISAVDGYNLMSFSTAFKNLSGGSNELEIYISGTTGNMAIIQPYQANIIFTGYGLIAQASWNGSLNLNDVIEAVVKYVYKTSVIPIESSIDITTITPDTVTASDEVGATVHKRAIQPDITEAIPYDIISVSNPTNNSVEFVFSNAVFMRSVGGVSLDSFALTGFIGTTPTTISVYEAGLEKPFAENLVDLSDESWEVSDGKLISSMVEVDKSKSYTATFITCTEPYTEADLDRFTESQLDFYREIELEGRQYECNIVYFDANGNQISSVEVTDYYQLEIPEGATSVRFAVAETTGREITADDLVCFYVKLEEGTESTVFRFSNKIVLKVDDLSKYGSSINFAIGETGFINPFTNEVINTASSGSFTRIIYEEASDV